MKEPIVITAGYDKDPNDPENSHLCLFRKNDSAVLCVISGKKETDAGLKILSALGIPVFSDSPIKNIT